MPHITSLNKSARYAQWLDVYSERLLPGDYVALMVAHTPEGYVFDAEEAARIKDKPLVVFDMREYGWSSSFCNMDLLGLFHQKQPEYDGEEWKRLNDWIETLALYFKRELSEDLLEAGSLLGSPVFPVDLISRNRPFFEPQTKDEFMARKGGVYSLHGYSHEDRIELDKMLKVWPTCDRGHKLNERYSPLAYSEIIHHTQRRPLIQVIQEQMQFMISCSLPGAGTRCFRDGEACVGCVPLVANLPIVRALPFTSDNSILVPTENGRMDMTMAIVLLETYLSRPEKLWEMYIAAQELARQYDPDAYVRDQINSKIKEIL